MRTIKTSKRLKKAISKREALAAAVMAVSSLFVATARADQTWGAGVGPYDGSWDNSSNWTTAVPSATDNVLFDATGIANPTVTLTAGELANALTFSADTYALTGGNLTLTTGNVTVTNITDTATISSQLIGATNPLTKLGAGKLVLTNAANSFTGLVSISGGTLSISANGQLGTAANAITMSDGTTLMVTGSMSTLRGLTLSGGPLGSTLDVTGANTFTYSGVIGGGTTGQLALVKADTGTLVLNTATNTFAGDIAINGGILNANTAQLGNSGSNHTIFINTNGTFQNTAGFLFGDYNPTANIIFSAGGGSLDASTANGHNFNLSNAGQLTGSGTLQVFTVSASGTNTLVVGAANTGFTGTLELVNGPTAVGALVQSTNKDAFINGTVKVTSGTYYTNIAGPVSITGNIIMNGGKLAQGANSGNTYTGQVSLNAASTFLMADPNQLGTARSWTIGGQITGSAGVTVSPGTGGGGTLTVSNTTNNWSSVVTINGGTLLNKSSTGTGNALGTTILALSGGNLTINDNGDGLGDIQNLSYGDAVTETAAATITVDRASAPAQNKNIQLGSLTINGSTLIITNSDQYGVEFTGASSLSGAPTFTVSNLVGAVNALAKDGLPGMKISGALSGSFGFTKNGNGILALTNAGNSFAGNISVTAGLLSINSDGALGDAANGTTNTITLAGGSGIGLQAAGTFSTARVLTLGSGGGTIDVTAGNALTVTSALAGGANALIKNNDGTLILNADNITPATWSGAITINDGAVRALQNNALGPTADTITVSATAAAANGAALQLAGGITIGANPLALNGGGINTAGALENVSSSNTYGGAITLVTASTIGSDASTLTLTGGISGAQALTFAGAGNISITTAALGAVSSVTKINSGKTTVSVASASFVGNLTVNAGTFAIADSGTIGGTGTVTVNPTGTLTLDDTGTNIANRMGTRNTTLSGGTLSLLGNGSAPTADISIGSLTFGTSGADVVTLTPGSGQNVKLTTGSLGTRAAGSSVVYQGPGLGVNSIASATANAANIVLTGQANQANLGTPTAGIFPYALVNDTTAGTYGFATYDTTNGVRALSGSETVSTLTASDNILATSTLTTAVNISVLSLTLSGSGALTNTNWALTDTSGGILAQSGYTGTGISGGTIKFGGTEAVIHTVGNLTISSVIAGTAGLTKADAGTLTLTSKEIYYGTTTINGGTLYLNSGADNTLPNLETMTVNAGGTLDLGGHSQLVGNFSSGIGTVAGAGGTVQSTGGIGTLFTDTGTSTAYAGTFAASVNLTKQGNSTLTLSNNSSAYNGVTTVSSGTLRLVDAGALAGTGGIALNFASLTLDNTGTLNLVARLNAGNAITSTGGTITYLGRASTNSSDSIGSLTLAGGQTTVTVTQGGTNSASATLGLAGLSRTDVNATFTMIPGSNATNLGTLANNGQYITIAGQGNGLIAGWATVRNQADNVADFAYYVSGLGVGGLSYTGFPAYNTTFDNGNTSTLITSVGATALNNAASAVNALKITGNITFGSNTNTLDIVSGGLIGDNGSRSIGGSVGSGVVTAGGTLASGTDQLFVHVTNGGTITMNSVIRDTKDVIGSGTAITTLVKDLAGGLTLTAPNLYTGGTIVNAGTLTLSGTASTNILPATGGLTINNGATVSESTNSQQFPTSLAPVINGGGTLTLTGNNTMASITFNSVGGTNTPTVNAGGVLTLSGSITATLSNYAVAPTITGGTLDLGGNSAFVITVNGAANTFRDGGQNPNPSASYLKINSIIQDGGIVKQGTGTLWLSNNANSFAGNISVVNGNLDLENAVGTVLGSNAYLGNGTGSIYLGEPVSGNNNVALLINFNNSSLARNIVVNGNNAGSGSVTIEAIEGGNTAPIRGNILLNSNVTFNTNLGNSGNGLNIQGIVTGTGGVTFTSTTAGYENSYLLTSAGNYWTGGTTILSGQVNPTQYSIPYNTIVTLDKGLAAPAGIGLGNGNGDQSTQIGGLQDGPNGGGVLSDFNNGATYWAIGNNTTDASFSGIIDPTAATYGFNTGGAGGSIQIAKVGSNTQTYNNTTTSGSNLWIDGGTWKLGSAGVMASRAISIQAGGTLALDSSDHGVGSVTRTGTVAAAGAITLAGNPTGNTFDALGAYTLRGGPASITITNAGTAGNVTTMTFASLGTRNTGEDGTILFSAPNLGLASAVGSTSVGHILFTGFATTANAGATNASILNYAIGQDTVSGAIGLVAYDATNGVRLLTSSEYANDATTGGTDPLNNAASKNVQLIPTDTQVLAGSIAQNALFLMGGGINVSGAATFTINSGGAILSTGGSASTISASTLAFGGEAIIHNVNNLNISSAITLTSSGFTKDGAGTLTLGSSSLLNTSGVVAINAGKVILGAANSFTVNTIVDVNGGTLDINGFNQQLDRLNGYGTNVTNALGSASSNGGTITNNGASNAIITFDTPNNANGVFYGSIVDGSKAIGLAFNTNQNTPKIETFQTNNPNAYNFSGGVTINNKAGMVFQAAFANSSNTNISFGSGNITLNNGLFEFDPLQFNGPIPNAFISPAPTTANAGDTTYGFVNFTNNVIVGQTGGAFYGLSTGPTNVYTNFTGTITLGGNLQINGSNNNGNAVWNRYTGSINIVQSAAAEAGLYYYQAGASYQSSVDGVISDGAGVYAHPLILTANMNTNGAFTITGVSTYANGTYIRAANSFVNLTAAGNVGTPALTYASDAQLGTGSVFLDPGAKLRVFAADNIKTASFGGTATVTVGGTPLSPAVFAIAYNPTSVAQMGIDPSSSGILAMDTNFTNITTMDMSAIGAGRMFLSAATSSTYAGTLSPGYDPAVGSSVKDTYYLGGASNNTGAGATLTLSGSNAVSGSNNLVVGMVNAVANSSGNIKFTANQSLSGTITVVGGEQFGCCSASGANQDTTMLEVTVQPTTGAAGDPFGTGANTYHLVGGRVQFDMPTAGVARSITIGDLNVDGGLADFAARNTTLANTITIGNGGTGIIRNNMAQLTLDVTGLGLAAGTTIMANNFVSSTNPSGNTVANASIAAPWITGLDGNFLGYATTADGTHTAGLGFFPTVYTINNVGGATLTVSGTLGSGLSAATVLSSDIVKWTAGGTDSSLAGGAIKTIYALRVQGGSSTIVGNAVNTAPATLVLTSGALSAETSNSNLFIGTNTTPGATNVRINIQAGDGTADLVVTTGAYFGQGGIYIANNVIANNIVKDGANDLTFSSQAQVFSVTGNVYINQGYIALGQISGANTSNGDTLFGASTKFVLNGGGLELHGNWALAGAATNWTHDIQIGPAGGGIVMGNNGGNGNAPITFTGNFSDQTAAGGMLSFLGGGTGNVATLTNTNTSADLWSGGTVIQANSAVVVSNNTNFGTGSVALLAPTASNGGINGFASLTLQGDLNLPGTTGRYLVAGGGHNVGDPTGNPSDTRLAIAPYDVVNFQSAAPSVGTLEGGGSVVLGTTTPTNTNLTIGYGSAANPNTYDVFDGTISQATGSASGITKVGTGTLVLIGVNSYTGATNVTSGTLNVVGSIDSTVGGVTVNNATLGGTGLVSGAVSLTGNGTLGNAALLTLGSTLGVTGSGNSIPAASNIAVAGATTVNNAAVFTVNGTLSGAGAAAVNGGTLNGTGTVSTNVTLASGTLNSSGTLTLGGTLGVSGAANQLSSGTVNVAGLTTVNSGASFAVNGTLGGAGSVSVNGTLSGGGTILQNVTVNAGGIYSPGNSPGTLTIGSIGSPKVFSIGAGSKYNWEASSDTAGQYDTVTVNGTISLTATNGDPIITPNTLGNFDPTGKSFVIMTYTGADPVNQPTWTIDVTNSVSEITVHWVDGTGNWSTASNWDLTGLDNSGATVTYDTANKRLVLSGLTSSGSITPKAQNIVVIDSSVSGTSVAVTGLSTPASISGLTIGDATANTSSLTLAASGDLTVTGPVSVMSNGTLDATLANLTAQSLANAGNTTLGSASTTATFTQGVTSTGGVLTINGAVTAPTGVTVSGGTLTGGASSSIAGSLGYSSSLASTFAGTISGASSAVSVSNGTLTLTNSANTYGGATTISGGGILSVSKLALGGSNSSIGSSSNAASNLIINGGTLQYTGSGDSTDRQFTIGQNGATIDSSGSGPVTFSNTAAITNTGSGPRTLTLTGSNAGINTFTATIGDGAGGSTSLVKNGTGFWQLKTASTFTGGTNVNQGTLQAGGTALSTGTVNVGNSGTLQVDAPNQPGIGVNWSKYGAGTAVNALSGDGAPGHPITTWNNLGTNFEMGFVNSLVNSAGASTAVAARLGNGGGTNDGAYNQSGSGSTEPLLGNGVGGFTPIATAITGIPFNSYEIILFVNNTGTVGGTAWIGTKLVPTSPTYSYTTTGNSNTFVQTTNTSNGFPSANYVVFAGLSGSSQTLWVANYSGASNADDTGGFEIIDTSSVPLTIGGLSGSGNFDLNGNGAFVGGNNLNTTFTGSIIDSNATPVGTLTKVGSGVLSLAGSDTFQGITRVSTGTLDIGNTNALQNSTLDMNVADAGNVTFSLGGSAVTLGGLQGTRNLDMGTKTLSIGNNNTSTTYSGSLSNGALTKIGTGTLTLAHSNTYSGDTRAGAGTLAVGNPQALQDSTLDMNGADTGTVTFAGPSTLGGLKGSRNLDMGGNTLSIGSNVSFPNGTTYSGVLSNGAIDKVGSGTLTLTNTHTYTGTTTVDVGTLLLSSSGSLNASSTVTVNGGGTLAGFGTANGSVVNNAGTIIAGDGTNTAGTLAVGSLTLVDQSVLQFTPISGSAAMYATINVVSNTTSFSGTTYIAFTNDPTFAGDYKLIQSSGLTDAILGNFDPNSLNSVPANTTYSLSTTTDSGYLDLIVTTTGGSLADGPGTWVGTTDNKWTTNNSSSNNWTGGYPGLANDIATFDDTGIAQATVDLDGSKTIGGIVLSSTSVGYTLGLTATANTLTLQNSLGASILVSGGASHTINAQVITASNTLVSVSGTASLNLVQGITNNTNTLTLTNTSSGTLTTGAISGSGNTTVSAGSVVTVASVRQNTLSIGASSASMHIATTGTPNQSSSTSVVSTLTIAGATNAWTGQLDLGDNSMVIHGGTLSMVQNQIVQGMTNVNHNGITSSTAVAGNGSTTLGYALASAVPAYVGGTFEGQSGIVSTDILIKYTYEGDANLDGVVNFADLGILASNYGSTNPVSWAQADFNGDGAVNFADLGTLASYYGYGVTVGTPLMSFQDALALFPQFSGGGTGSVPEPTSLGLLGLGAVGLLTRRRRK